MSRMISRQEAARLLGVDLQTVSNWVSKGVIKGHFVDKRLLLDKTSIERYFDTLQDVAATDAHIRQMQEALSVKEKELNQTLDDLLSAEHLAGAAIPKHIFCQVLEAVLLVAGEDILPSREHEMLVGILRGTQIESIGQKFGLSRSRVIQLMTRALGRILQMKNFSDLRRENRDLLQENDSYKRLIISLQRQKEELEAHFSAHSTIVEQCYDRSGCDPGHLTTLLSTEVSDMHLSTRTLNCLKVAGIKTLADLVSHKSRELLKFRNFGQKSLSELEASIDGLGLQWGMDVTSILAADMFRKREHEKLNL